MPKISKSKKEKIQEQILHHLYTIAPESVFTSTIAENIIRDEEFTKNLLLDLKEKKLIIEINKNSKGKSYAKRQRWRISNEAFLAYQKHQQQ